MIGGILENIGQTIQQNFWLAPFLSLAAGVLTSLTPCSLSAVPLVIGFVGGAGTDTRKAFRLSLILAIGSAVTFTALGVAASLLGTLIGASGGWWYIFLGILMVLMALQTWEIFEFIPPTFLISKNIRRSYLGAFLAGVLGGLFSSPCSTPVLIALLAIVADKGSIAWGIILMLLYSAGHGVLTVAAGTSTGFAKKLSGDKRYGKLSQVLKFSLGFIILLIGFYMFYLGF